MTEQSMGSKKEEATFWAHTREGTTDKQPLSEHLEEVGRLAGEAASKFGAGEFGTLAGVLHDAGKYDDRFQRRLGGSKERVDHSTTGAQIAYSKDPRLFLLSLAIMGHHGGIPDMGMRTDAAGQSTGFGRLNKPFPKDAAERWASEMKWTELAVPVPFRDISQEWAHAQMMTFGRFLYSCLVDADFRDTARFCGEERLSMAYNADDTRTRVSKAIAQLQRRSTPSPLNDARNTILHACRTAALRPQGLYNLTVPTGGGKTHASLAFAAEHAAEHKLDRIIYVAPYTSIIDQTGRIYADILGEDKVLQHHHGVEYDDDDILHRHAVENWEMPVVVTTAVQFFESLYSNKPSKCRKLHNIANSVVVIDEVQTLPEGYLRACVISLAELIQNYGATVVLCTATQPALNDLFRDSPLGAAPQEICPPGLLNTNVFRRAQIQRRQEQQTVAMLASELAEYDQVLTIVNKRKTAQELFDAVTEQLGEEGCFHLSTFMTPAHRLKTLDEIRLRLQKGQDCRVVATNLVEAGVDLDFPAVYREEAALDSIVQSAGRCNREGRSSADESIVRVFRLGEPVPDLQRYVETANQTMDQFDDCTSPEAIAYYYTKVRGAAGEKSDDVSGVARLTKGDQSTPFPYETVASRFKFIEDKTRPVYVPSPESTELIGRLRCGERSRELFRALDAHQVPLYPNQLQTLEDAGMIESLDNGEFSILLLENNPEAYAERTGLRVVDDTGKGIVL